MYKTAPHSINQSQISFRKSQMATVCQTRPSILLFESSKVQAPMLSDISVQEQKLHPRAQVYLKPVESLFTASSSLNNLPSYTTTNSNYFDNTGRLSKLSTKYDHGTHSLDSSLKLSKPNSILKNGDSVKGSQCDSLKRCDTNGVQILEGSKKHVVSFKTKIHTVSFVENWKEFNKDTVSKTSCTKCNIF